MKQTCGEAAATILAKPFSCDYFGNVPKIGEKLDHANERTREHSIIISAEADDVIIERLQVKTPRIV